MDSVVVLIPARFASSRFPGKPLAQIKGKSMVERVYFNCKSSGFECAVVTDNDQIEQAVRAFGGNVLRVDDDVPSGSERIALAYERFMAQKNPSLVINVQGDEPLLQGSILKELAQFHLHSNFDIATLIRPRNSAEAEFKNPNVVKAVWSSQSKQCFYFSRQSLPFNRDGDKDYIWHQHIGVYSYKPQALLRYVKMPVSRLEDLEKLEQLRALENGFTIGAVTTEQKLIGVDVPDDINKVEGALCE
jgi:3-deoxy-manno-octulosonate cytidylyltransferase (CMP-KDO synthetase)